MTNYFTTQESTIKAAEEAKSENFGTIVKKGSTQCACGESFACFLVDENTNNTLEEFVCCEACHNEN